VAIVKDARDIRRDQEFLHEGPAGHRILNVVADQSATAVGSESMLMHP